MSGHAFPARVYAYLEEVWRHADDITGERPFARSVWLHISMAADSQMVPAGSSFLASTVAPARVRHRAKKSVPASEVSVEACWPP